MTFNGDDLKQVKEKLSNYGVEPGIDVCNYFDYPYEIAALVVRLEKSEALERFTEHDSVCVRSSWEAGEPTEDGGYRIKFNGKWYRSKPTDETPKCDCGLDDALKTWYEAGGGGK